MNEIIFTGCVPDFNQISLTKLLMDKTGMKLHEAKRYSDSIMENDPVSINIESYDLAKIILTEGIKSGALGKIIKKD